MFKKLFSKKDDVEKVELTEEEKAEKKAMRTEKLKSVGKTVGCFALGVGATLGGLVLLGNKAKSEDGDETDETCDDTVSDDSEN